MIALIVIARFSQFQLHTLETDICCNTHVLHESHPKIRKCVLTSNRKQQMYLHVTSDLRNKK